MISPVSLPQAIAPAAAATGSPDKELPDVAQLAEQHLNKSTYHALRGVTCLYHEGIITICGRVPSFYLKQVAQSIVGAIEEVGGVINRLEVVGRLPRNDECRPGTGCGR